MLLWELHDTLARGLQDPLLNIDGTNYGINNVLLGEAIPDGTRYSTRLRNEYLYRSMKKILRDAKMSRIGIPYNQISSALVRLFPSMVYNLVIALNDLGRQPDGKYWIVSIAMTSKLLAPYIGTNIWSKSPTDIEPRNIYTSAFQTYPLPYNPNDSVNVPIQTVERIDLIAPNHKYSQPYIAYVSGYDDNVWLTMAGDDIPMLLEQGTVLGDDSKTYLNVFYIHDVPNLFELNPSETVNGIMEPTRVDFEETYYDSIISNALLFANADDGTLGSISQSVQMLELNRFAQGGQSNGRSE